MTTCADKLVRPVGSWVALITPFTAGDKVDIKGFAQLVDFQAANGSDGVIFMGSTGESTSLSMAEKREIIEAMAEYCRGKIPALFGVTCPTTRDTVELAQFAEAQGADGIMLVVPPYIAPPQESVYEFFATVAKSVSIAVALYNNPSRVIVNIDSDTVLRLAEIPNVVADKEAMPNVSQLADVMHGAAGKINVLCCDFPKYSLILPTLALGGHGTANVAGNIIPKEMAEMSRPWTSWEDVERTRALYAEYSPILKAVYSVTNPVAVKAAVELLGLPAGKPRPPLPTMQGEKLEAMKQLVERFKLREKYNL
ncbi:MAG: 4-hydroxy-tetrahydrodipicolinate synthase [Firmicutes bacterium]|jgi:4-hydroxy-tetrahydrodipicolinate synthase|nr:4-hydroxy-tetrahydrodipicolinate synthase [Bacillota bacterium]